MKISVLALVVAGCLSLASSTAVENCIYDDCNVCNGTNACGGYFESTLVFWATDSWIDQMNRSNNNFQDGLLEVRWNRSRAVLHFEEVRHALWETNRNNSPLGVPIVASAFLRLRIADVSDEWSDPQVAVHRLVNFDPQSVTWDCSSHDIDTGCEQWRQIGLLPQVQPCYNPVPADVQDITPGARFGVMEFDVSSDVQEALNTTLQLSFLVKKQFENTTGVAHFWSSKSGPQEQDYSVYNNSNEGKSTGSETPVSHLGPELVVVIHTPFTPKVNGAYVTQLQQTRSLNDNNEINV